MGTGTEEEPIPVALRGRLGGAVLEHGNPGDPAYTIRAGRVGTVMVDGVRRLTPLECERLQGFPDGHTAGESDSARYRMLGNAEPVPVVEWIAKRLVAVHGRD